MSYESISAACPYCGYENKTRVEFKNNIQRIVTRCGDDDAGIGCEKLFVIECRPVMQVKVATMGEFKESP